MPSPLTFNRNSSPKSNDSGDAFLPGASSAVQSTTAGNLCAVPPAGGTSGPQKSPSILQQTQNLLQGRVANFTSQRSPAPDGVATIDNPQQTQEEGSIINALTDEFNGYAQSASNTISELLGECQYRDVLFASIFRSFSALTSSLGFIVGSFTSSSCFLFLCAVFAAY